MKNQIEELTKFIQDNYLQLNKDIILVYQLAKELFSLTNTINMLAQLVNDTLSCFNGELVKTQLAKYRQHDLNSPVITHFKDTALLNKFFPDFFDKKLTDILIDLSCLELGKMNLEQIFNLQDSQIIKIILLKPLQLLFSSGTNASVIDASALEFSSKLYSLLKYIILEKNNPKHMLEHEDYKKNFFFFIDLIQIFYDWVEETLRLYSYYKHDLQVTYYEFLLLYAEFEFNTEEQTEIKNYIEIIKNVFIKLDVPDFDIKKFFEKIFRKYQHELSDATSLLYKKITFRNYKHPIYDLEMEFIKIKKWSNPLHNLDLKLVMIMTLLQGKISITLKPLNQVKRITTNYTEILKMVTKFKNKKSEILNKEHAEKIATEGSKANFRYSSHGKSLTYFSKKHGDSQNLFNENDIANISSSLPDIDPMLDGLIKSRFIMDLSFFAENIDQFTEYFVKKLTLMKSQWLRLKIDSFLDEALPVKRLKLMLIGHIFSIKIPHDLKNSLQSDDNEIIRKDIDKILNSLVEIEEKNNSDLLQIKDFKVLSFKEILSLNDFQAIAMLNAHTLPSEKRGRHPYETKERDLIELLHTLYDKKNIKDYHDLCYNFFDPIFGHINLNLDYCFRTSIHFWFLLTVIYCGLEEEKFISDNFKVIGELLAQYTQKINFLLRWEWGKKILSDLIAGYCGLSGSKLELEEMATIRLEDVLNNIEKLNFEDLQEDLIKNNEVIAILDFINKIYKDLIIQFKNYANLYKSYNHNIVKIGLENFYQGLESGINQQAMIERMLLTIKKLDAKPEDLCNYCPELKNYFFNENKQEIISPDFP